MTAPTVGYVGLDHHHTRPYLESLEQLPASVTSVCEPDESYDPTALEGHVGDVPTYRDPIELLDADAPDVVWITLPSRDTPAVIDAALDRGIDVYTEKPAARTAADLQALARRDTDSTVCVSYPWRAHPAARELRNRAAEDFFGRIRTFETRYAASDLKHRDTDHYLFDRAASRGGIVQWLGVHWIDLLSWAFDDSIVAVDATMTGGPDDESVEDGAIVQFELASGAIGVLTCGYYLREGRYDTYVSVTGTHGRVAWDPVGDYFGFEDENTIEFESMADGRPAAPREYLTYDYDPTPGYGGGFGLEFMRQFLEARQSADVDVPASLDDAVTVLRILDAVYESARADEWISVGQS